MKLFNLGLCCLFFLGIRYGELKNKTTKLTYADQNNNDYLITETSFGYIPITEKESSYDTYSVNEAVSKAVTTQDFEEIHTTLAQTNPANAATDVKPEMTQMHGQLLFENQDVFYTVAFNNATDRTQFETYKFIF